MKTKVLLLLILSITSSLSKNNFNKEGFSSNTENDMVESVAYGLAKEMKTDDYYLQNSKDYKQPQIVEKLPPKTNLNSGPVETADEIPSEETFFDGTKSLKITKFSCGAYTTKEEVCLHQGSCGWCGSSNSCIPGNNLGPLAPCLRGTYKFTSPNSNWNPIQGQESQVSRANLGGAQLTTFVSNQ